MEASTQRHLISVIIPTFNEMNNSLLKQSLQYLITDPELEIVVVDKNSTDGTVNFLKELGVNIISTPKNFRSDRLNLGITKTAAKYVLLHHPRNRVSPESIDELKKNIKPNSWGGFTHHFYNNNHWLLNFTSWYSNNVRFDIRGIVYLDHCIFFDRNLLSESLIPSVDIFEDTLLSLRLLKRTKPLRLKSSTQTSAVRFIKNGIIKQSLINQFLKWCFYFGASKEKMNKLYETNLSLNSEYDN